MFTKIQALRFRCLRNVDQELNRFSTLVGPNASGKTTFLDVIGFLSDLMRNGGKVGETARDRSADFQKLLWNGQGNSFQLAVEAVIPDHVAAGMGPDKQRYKIARYELEIGIDLAANAIGLEHEALILLEESAKPLRDQRELFPMHATPPSSIFMKSGTGRKIIVSHKPSGNANYYSDGKKSNYNPSFRLGPDTCAMANIPADAESFQVAPWFRSLLIDGVQSLKLNSQKMSRPSPPGLGKHFLPDGANLPWVLSELKGNTKRFEQWLDHVRTALPDIESITSVERPEDRHRYLVISYEGGATVPSWLVSDGTLRLLALTIPAYLSDQSGIFLIEEPENGIHPQALETVLQSLSSIYDGQVLLATHSPVALNMLDSEDILCFAKDELGATDIVRGSHHPALKEWKKGAPVLGVLFAAGILS